MTIALTQFPKAVYRLYNGSAHDHLYTRDFAEATSAVSGGYAYEGVEFLYDCPDKVAVLRARNGAGTHHFITVNQSEIDTLVHDSYWIDETSGGAAPVFYVQGSTSGDVPVHRLYNSAQSDHLWTWDVNEIQKVEATSGWVDEGVAFYVSKLEVANLPVSVQIVDPVHLATITLTSFGYYYGGPPSGQRYNMEVDKGTFFIDAPSYSLSVNARDDSSVYNTIYALSKTQSDLAYMVKNWLPNLKNGDHISVGCSRGHHRSVTLIIAFAAILRAHGFKTVLVYRDINKS